MARITRIRVGTAVLRGYHNKPIPRGVIPFLKVTTKRKKPRS